MSSIDGNIEKSSGPLIYMVVKRIISENEIFRINMKSRKNGGNGMIIKAITTTTKIATMLFMIFM